MIDDIEFMQTPLAMDHYLFTLVKWKRIYTMIQLIGIMPSKVLKSVHVPAQFPDYRKSEIVGL